jgi:hypothetical protein
MKEPSWEISASMALLLEKGKFIFGPVPVLVNVFVPAVLVVLVRFVSVRATVGNLSGF